MILIFFLKSLRLTHGVFDVIVIVRGFGFVHWFGKWPGTAMLLE